MNELGFHPEPNNPISHTNTYFFKIFAYVGKEGKTMLKWILNT
jgi:hypothetical protein